MKVKGLKRLETAIKGSVLEAYKQTKPYDYGYIFVLLVRSMTCFSNTK